MSNLKPEEVRVFAELVRLVRTVIILDTMHEFLSTEVKQDSFLWDAWQKACDLTQEELEELFQAVNVHHLEGWAADDKAGDAPTK